MPTSRKESLLRDIRHDRGDFEPTGSGDLQRIEGVNNLNQALNHRLITVKGTLVHRPEYGVGIQNYQGRLSNLDTQRELALNIRDQFLRDERVESVEQVQFILDDYRPDLFQIFVKYIAVGYNQIDETFDPFELGV